MIFTMDWLRDFVDLDCSPEELAEKLTMAGLEVDSIHRTGDGIDDRVVVGRVVEVKRHPNADKLAVCKVDIGDQELQIVCGAPNVREGMFAPTALIGARLPGGFTIRRVKLRGVESFGMLCSEKELGISEEASGLMVLDSDSPVGRPITEALGLPMVSIELDLTPNRGDCLSVYGIAREVAAITGNRLKPLDDELVETGEDISEVTSVTITAPDLCPRYTARVIKGVRIAPSPWWMRRRLKGVGLRPINNVVDITNYVLMEIGHPLHAFDYDRLAENRIIVRRAEDGEEMETLDGVARRLTSDMLVIADAEKAVALAGVMGSSNSEVTDTTTNVLLESAYFDPVSIRKTSKANGMHTDASHRFERGTDIEGLVTASRRATELIRRIAGGVVCRGMADAYPKRKERILIEFRPDRCNYLLGTELNSKEMEEILTRLQIEVTGRSEGKLKVIAPTFRPDITREVDLIEEIARIHGYDNIPTVMPSGVIPEAQQNRRLTFRDRARAIAVAAGMCEAINYSFHSPGWFDMMNLPPDDPRRKTVRLRNPLSEEQSVMRTTLVPSLIQNVVWNVRHQVGDVRLFEFAKTFHPVSDDPDQLPEERELMAGVLSGNASESGWQESEREADFFDIKGIVEGILDAFNLKDVKFRRSKEPFMHPGRSADIILGNREIGFLGELHPDVQENWDIAQRIHLFELDFESIIEMGDLTRDFAPIPVFPKVTRDIALLVAEEVEAQVVTDIISSASSLISSVKLFDVYEGNRIPKGMKSLAYSVDFVSHDKTLTDREVDGEIAKLLGVLEKEIGARLRDS